MVNSALIPVDPSRRTGLPGVAPAGHRPGPWMGLELTEANRDSDSAGAALRMHLNPPRAARPPGAQTGAMGPAGAGPKGWPVFSVWEVGGGLSPARQGPLPGWCVPAGEGDGHCQCQAAPGPAPARGTSDPRSVTGRRQPRARRRHLTCLGSWPVAARAHAAPFGVSAESYAEAT